MRINPEEYRTRYIFDRVKSLWPDEIDVRDGELLGGMSGNFPTLSKFWDEAEAKCAAKGFREIDDLGVWAMFSLFHSMAVKRRSGGKESIFKSHARIARFDYEMQRNLINGYWKEERALYLSVNREKQSCDFTEGRKYVFSEFKPYYRKNK